MKTRFNVGLVGFGYIGNYHYKAILKQNSNFFLSTIFEKNLPPEKKKKIPKEIKIFSSFKKNNIPNNIDILVITAPTNLHLKFGKIAIEKVQTVIIEKPLGIKLKQAEQLINHALKLKKKLLW